MHFAGPLDHYSRLKTFFRAILSIPIWILRYVVNLLFEIGAVAAWFVILITGKLPRGLFDVMVLANSYTGAVRTPTCSCSPRPTLRSRTTTRARPASTAARCRALGF